MNPSRERALLNRSGAERCACAGDCGKHRNRCIHRDGQRMIRAGGGACRLRDVDVGGRRTRFCGACAARFPSLESQQGARPTSAAAPYREFIPYPED